MLSPEEQEIEYRRICDEIQAILDANHHLLFGAAEAEGPGMKTIPDWFLAIGSRTDTLGRPTFAEPFLASDSSPYALVGLVSRAVDGYEAANDAED